MPKAIYVQSSFLGGEWNPASQGRFDHPWYKTALNVCVNAIITEEGGWLRRSGTEFIGPTYLRQAAAVRTLFNDSAHRYAVVLTTNGSTGWAHFFIGDKVLCTSVTGTVTSSSSSAGILTLGFGSSLAVTNGDQVILSSVPASGAQYLNRWMTVESGGGTSSITLKDDTGTAFGFDSTSNALNGAVVNQILRLTHGIHAALSASQVVCLGVPVFGQPIESLLFAPGQPPQLISFTAGTPDSFSISGAAFLDGPYFDPQTDSASVSGYSGSITLTPSVTTFSATDVGRAVRIFTQPAAWASGTTYTNGQFVTDSTGAWWEAVLGTAGTNLGIVPGTLFTTSTGAQVIAWSPAPTAGQWAWGTITAQAGSSCTVTLNTPLNSANGPSIAASNWRLGVIGVGGTDYPICGTLCQGRLYIGGAVEGRFDASNTGINGYLTFSPTDPQGNVFDNHSISFSQIASKTQDHIAWFLPVKEGLEIGTVAAEYLLSAGSGTAITPSNLQLTQCSSWGSIGTPVVQAGVSTLFLQVGGQRVIEYVVDVFATSPSGRILNEFAKHLATNAGLQEISYGESKTPILWARQTDGRLIGCTYRRFSRFMSQPPDFAGWHQHWIGNGLRLDYSQCSVPPVTGISLYDSLYMVTQGNGAGPAYGVELLQPVFGDI